MSDGPLEAVINESLEKDLERVEREKHLAEQELARLRHDITKLNDKVIAYLPQLTHMSTNLSKVASAVQAANKRSDRIADALEGLSEHKDYRTDELLATLDRIATALENTEGLLWKAQNR